jgi:hypothetical protein
MSYVYNISPMPKFHLPSSTSSLIITIKHKAKYRFYVAAVLLVYFLQRKVHLQKLQMC